MLRLQRGCGYHKVPGSVLGDYMEQIIGKPEEAKQKLLEQFSKEIEETFPYKPGINCTEAQFAAFCTCTDTLDIIEDPAEFCTGEVRVEYETCLVVSFISDFRIFADEFVFPEEGAQRLSL